MKKGSSRLSLGPIPKPESVKLTITVSAELKARLDAYAEAHSRLHDSSVEVLMIIPHILDAFISRDRGFKRSRSPAGAREGSVAAADEG